MIFINESQALSLCCIMSHERWQKIEHLFHAALEHRAEERAAFLDEACAGDESLRNEIELLLSADSQEENPVETLPWVLAARWMEKGRRKSIIGAMVGHYRITAQIGSGGMGEVFLAEDTKLGRRVALKFLPHQYTEDEERVRRFKQEARAASALNHPNIITIYEIGEWNEVNFIATEFIEGPTLRERIQHSPMPITEVLDTGIQVANALAAAHAAGIVHRDIKPANVMVRGDGYVKVLDFGLAKLAAPDSAATDQHTYAKTDPGRVMGTISYMSPEQALGQPIDHRTDLFSLGVVLYEMATGKQPFAGNSDAAVYSSLLNKAPEPITRFNPELPVELEAIINRALAKDREARYQTASDLREDLKQLKRDPDSRRVSTITASRPVRLSWNRWTARALLGSTLIGLLVIALFLWPRFRSNTREGTLSAKTATFAPLTDQPGPEYFPSLSPDGSSLVYASRATGKWDIYLQRVGGKNTINLTKDSMADDTQPAFSSDSEHIAFRSERDGGGIFIMGATGESPKRLTDFGYTPAWSFDGKEVVCAADHTFDPNNRTIIPSPLWTVNTATGERRLVAKGDAVQPSWSPHGDRIAYWGVHRGGQRDIWTVPARGGDPVSVTDDAPVDWNPVWSPDGKYLFFASDRSGSMNLWRVPIEETTGKVLGTPEPITTPSAYSGFLSFSRDGRRLAYVQVLTNTNLQQIAFDVKREKIVGASSWITQGSKIATNPDLSPGGDWFVFDSVGAKQEDLFVVGKDGTGFRQLTNDTHKDRAPSWSPDGKKIVFFSDRSGRYDTWTINPDGSGLQQITFTEGRGTQLSMWSPDGMSLLCNLQRGAPIILDPNKPWNEQTPKVLPLKDDSNEWFLAFSWSRDGTKLAGVLRPPGSLIQNLVTYSFASGTFEKLTDFGFRANWLSDSRRLVFCDDKKIYLLDSQSRRFREIFSVAPNRLQSLGLSRDNNFLYYSLTTTEADVWLMSMQ